MSRRLLNGLANFIIPILVLACAFLGSSVMVGLPAPIDEPKQQDSPLDSMQNLESETSEPELELDLDPLPDIESENEMDQDSKEEAEEEDEEDQEPEPEYFTIAMMGDCTFASDRGARGSALSFETVVGDDFSYPFSLVKHLYEEDDFVIVNFESSMAASDTQNDRLFHFRADPKYVNVLVEAGVHFAALGNNHSMDNGHQSYLDMQEILSSSGVGFAANGEWCLYLTERGLIIGIYSKNMASDADVSKAVAEMKDAGAELIILALHWGDEGSYRETSWQQQVGRAAIDAGAHIIMGTHPHTLQRMESYNDGIIYYSLGNWSFGGNTNPRDKDSVLARVTIMRDIDGEISVVETDNIPCSVSGSQTINDYRPVPYEVDSDEYIRTLSKLNGSFTGPNLVVSYNNPESETPSPPPAEEGNAPEAETTPPPPVEEGNAPAAETSPPPPAEDSSAPEAETTPPTSMEDSNANNDE